MKPLRDKKGRWAGSIGSGTTPTPAPALPSPPATPQAVSSEETQPAVEGAYEAFRTSRNEDTELTDTYPARLAAYHQAGEAYRQAAELSDSLREKAGGRAIPEGFCATCGHSEHSANCRQSIQVMSDLWEMCPCQDPQAPTEAQARAGAAMKITSIRYREYVAAEEEAAKLLSGDKIIVARGRKVPRGTAGQIIRVWNGDYGLRVLFRNEAGEEVWVAASNIERCE